MSSDGFMMYVKHTISQVGVLYVICEFYTAYAICAHYKPEPTPMPV
jgi:hypothetical protein